MLVLTRKKNQSIMLGDDIKITILDIDEDAIKIGITAPKNVLVLRAELYQAVKEENTSAAASGSEAVKILQEILPRP